MGIKNKFLMVLSVLLVLGLTAFAAPQGITTDYFVFDESKMDVGSMYHYIASDIAGKYPMDTFVYVKSRDTIVVYKDYKTLFPDLVLLR